MNLLKNLDELPLNSGVCLYGGGREGKTFTRLLEKFRKDVTVVLFVDDNGTGQMGNVEIRNPENLKHIQSMFDVILIISEKWKEIEKILKDYEIYNYLIVSYHLQHKILCEFIEREDSAGFLYGGDIFTEKEFDIYKDNIKKARELLSTENDKKLYNLLIENRRNIYSMDILLKYHMDNFDDISCQYLEFINKRSIRTVIEGGVAAGGTTYRMYKWLRQDCMIYGFEPDYNQYLQGSYKKELDKIPNIHVLPQALWEYKATLRLVEGSIQEAGRIIFHEDEGEENKYINVNAISIDEFVRDNNIGEIDFIKLDVEGAELEVLKGAEKTIVDQRPQMAISIYHTKEHLFQIPLYLKSILENYVYKIGSYHPSSGEKILYAIPEEIAGL